MSVSVALYTYSVLVVVLVSLALLPSVPEAVLVNAVNIRDGVYTGTEWDWGLIW